jgi:hypothetical protein
VFRRNRKHINSSLIIFTPYSLLPNGNGQKTQGTLKGGLDIKYGINDAFTLDAILIPDFGQTKLMIKF